MTDLVTRWNAWLNGIVWGPPMLILLIGTGVVLTLLTGAVQFRHLHTALREVLGKLTHRGGGAGSVTPFQAVATALASTVGVGNVAGVATAIFLGGPGALFWLWVSGLVGMATKYAEIVIALHYREPDAAGVMRGGNASATSEDHITAIPMYPPRECVEKAASVNSHAKPAPTAKVKMLFRRNSAKQNGIAVTSICAMSFGSLKIPKKRVRSCISVPPAGITRIGSCPANP